MRDLQTLQSQLASLINQYSLLEIAIALKNLCKKAHENQPGFEWDKDTDALTAVIERINN